MIAHHSPWIGYKTTALPVQRGAKGRTCKESHSRISWTLLAVILAHIPFAFLMQRVPVLPKVHSLAVLGVGLWFATGRRSSAQVAQVAAYIAGSEVLWRMCGGGFFWEFGKYGFALVLGVALARKGIRAWDPSATGYFLLLLPAMVLTLVSTSLASTKNYLSFYLSGPLALAVGVSFFFKLRLSTVQLRSVLLAGLIPVVGAAALCYRSTFGSDEVEFGSGANFAASGGFGPNQVSATLGFGIVVAALCLWLTPASKPLRALLVGAILLFVTQALLTMSRTGIWLGAISCLLAGLHIARSPRRRLGLVLGAMTIGLFCWLIVFPAVEELSGGAVSKRFQSSDGTGREQIAKADFQVWAHHPLFGVGIGIATPARTEFGIPRKGSHTEFTRLLSEHGLLGLISLSLLIFIAVRAYRSARTIDNKVLAVAAISFSFLFMSVSAMRLVLPSFMLALACVRLEDPMTQPWRTSSRFPVTRGSEFMSRSSSVVRSP